MPAVDIAALCENRYLDPASFLRKVELLVEQFRSGEQHDDVTMVIARSR